MKNSINWFEIPVIDFARAKKFYETLYGAEIMEMPFPDGKYGMLPCDMQNGGVGWWTSTICRLSTFYKWTINLFEWWRRFEHSTFKS